VGVRSTVGFEHAADNGSMTILGKANSPELDEIAWYMGNAEVDYEGGFLALVALV